MGLTSKQVSGEAFDWAKNLMQTGALELPKVTPMRQQQQSGPPLKCPRCESMNTKFCYFNNYNQSQPRHFCKSCRRHWTKGGTLRDVPVGGGRKNKRVKRCNSYKTNGNKTAKDAVQSQQQEKLLLEHNEENKFYDILHQSFFQPTSESSHVKNSHFCSTETMSSVVPLPNLLSTALSSFSYTSSFETPFNHSGEAKLSEDLISTTATTMTPMPVQWHTPTPSGSIDSSSYWNFDDLNTFMSPYAKEQWDDSVVQQLGV